MRKRLNLLFFLHLIHIILTQVIYGQTIFSDTLSSTKQAKSSEIANNKLSASLGYSAGYRILKPTLLSLQDLAILKSNSWYMFTHASAHFPFAEIPTSYKATPLEKDINFQLDQIKAETELGIMPLIDFLEVSPVRGFIVIHQGKIVYESYPGMQPTDRHLWFSVSNTVTATAIALLEAEGKINTDAPVSTYIPRLKGTDWENIPILYLLNMASGMDAGYPTNNTDITFTNSFGYLDKLTGFYNLEKEKPFDVYSFIASLKKREDRSRIYQYSAVDAFVLGWLVEEVSGNTLADFISKRIWMEAGTERDAMLMLSEQGTPANFLGMYSTLRDMARFGQLFITGSHTVNNNLLLPGSYFIKVQKGGMPFLHNSYPEKEKLFKYLGEKPLHNTYLWDAVMEDGDLYSWGLHGQGLYVSPSRNLIIAYFSAGDVSQQAFARAIATSGLFTY